MKQKFLAILGALRIFHTHFEQSVILESDSFNVTSWMKSSEVPWKMKFYFNEIQAISSRVQVSFVHVSSSANGMAD